ncbi:hypothetical protein BH20BAC1_BH20BAC1_21730 [soil metagenome]
MNQPSPMDTCSYERIPDQVIGSKTREIHIFKIQGNNIDEKVVKDFGAEWIKFHEYDDDRIRVAAEEYFDIVTSNMVNRQTYALDIGCGTGRWTKYLSSRVGFIEAVDPSNAIYAADKLLRNIENVRLTKASIETLPFPDETFDFAMSIGVLHHVPDTVKAMSDCVRKVKTGGYFYVYLYYDFEKRGFVFKSLFVAVNMIRKIVSRLPSTLKEFVCDLLAVCLYLPIISIARFFKFIGLKEAAKKIPLSAYTNKSFYIIRNDALDRFGTRLEKRFSKQQVHQMMEDCGLTDIVISPSVPYYHAVGKKL